MSTIPQGNVTTIRVFVNMTSAEVSVRNFENHQDNCTIPANSVVVFAPDGDAMRIPWCDSSWYWGDRHIDLVLKDPTRTVMYSIWQSGPIVRYTTGDQWISDGAAVPGDATVGNQKIAIFGKDLSLRCQTLSDWAFYPPRDAASPSEALQ